MFCSILMAIFRGDYNTVFAVLLLVQGVLDNNIMVYEYLALCTVKYKSNVSLFISWIQTHKCICLLVYNNNNICLKYMNSILGKQLGKQKYLLKNID